MIDLSIIEDEIAAIEEDEGTTYDTCQKLACLYIVRDHLVAKTSKQRKTDTSEFMKVAVGIPITDLMEVMDEHMEAIRIVYPAEYEAIVNKIRALHDKLR